MNTHQQRTLRESWSLLAPHADALAGHCLDYLVTHDPAFYLVLYDADLAEHRRAFVHVLAVGVRELPRLAALVPDLHRSTLGPDVIGPAPVGAALAWAVERTLGPCVCSAGVAHAWYAFGALLATAASRRTMAPCGVRVATEGDDARSLARAA